MNRAINDSLIKMIVKDGLPFSIVNSVTFRAFIGLLNKNYRICDRKQLREKLDTKFEAIKAKMKDAISSSDAVSLTTDLWTDKHNCNSYIAITCHFLWKNNVNSFYIATKEMRETHTANNLERMILAILTDWNISTNQVTSVTTDNGRNIVNDVKNLFGASKWLPCFAHTLNLVVTDSLSASPAVSEIIHKVKNLVTFFKQSTNASNTLKSIQENDNSTPLKLKQSVITRWNSVHTMIDRFISVYKYVSIACINIDSSPDCVTKDELSILKEISSLLKPFFDATTEMSAEKYSTCSKILPKISMIKASLFNINVDAEVSKILKSNLIASFEKRFSQSEKQKLIAISTVCDPRFKRLYFTDPTVPSRVQRDIEAMLSDTVCTQVQDDDDNIDGLWTFHRKVIDSNSALFNDSSSASLKSYLAQNVIDLKRDPIEFWNNEINKESYPELRKVALKYMLIPATSVPSERVFSRAGFCLNSYRSSLEPKRAEKLIMLSSVDDEFW